ncbi:MAG TPA: hypothetical protein VKS22_04240 [Candidatus Binataceae bacterium]|nr:hypothetical protein [Candidatus Binataceae bacterium]
MRWGDGGQNAQKDGLDAAVDALNGAAEKAWQPPHKRVEALLDRLMVGIHPSRRGEVADLVNVANPRIVEAISRGDEQTLTSEKDKLAHAIRFGGFSNAKVEPSQIEIWEKPFRLYGWDSGEVGVIKGRVKPGMQIQAVSWWAVKIDGHVHKREEIRLGMRLAWDKETTDREFLERYDARNPIPATSTVEFQASRDPEIRAALERVRASGMA